MAVVFLLDTVTRLAAPAAFLSLTAGWVRGTVLATAVVASLGVLRGLLVGLVSEQREMELWRDLVASIRATTIVDLKARANDERTWRLVDAAQRVVELETTVAPRVAANVVALLATAGLAVTRVDLAWLGIGVVCLLVIVSIAVPSQRAIRRAQHRSHQHLTDLGADLDVLLEAGAEIRVHGREAALSEALLGHAERSARARRSALTWSALVGLLPLGGVLLALALPSLHRGVLGDGAAQLVAAAMQAGIFGAAGLVFAVGVARGLEAYAHAAPHRRLVEAMLAAGSGESTIAATRAEPSVVAVRRLGVVYRGAMRSTPGSTSFEFQARSGIALLGVNGTGKTTVAHCLLGLVRATEGAIEFDGALALASDLAALRAHSVYLPQAPYWAPERSVAWHLDLVGGATDAHIQQEALERVGLWERLGNQAPEARLEAKVGALSGGEKRRLALARLFLPRAEEPWLYVLDEPEAGLDREGRAWLRSHLEDLARRARVLLVVHDRSVVPSTFEVIECQASGIPE